MPNIWKISHSSHGDNDHQTLIENNLLAIRFLEQLDQGNRTIRDRFAGIPEGDYFYLVRRGNIILFGQFGAINPALIISGNVLDGYNGMQLSNECNRNLCRAISIIKPEVNISNNQINNKTKKLGHMPSGYTTVFQVPTTMLKQFEVDVLNPVFAKTLVDLQINIDNIPQKNEISALNDQIISQNQILYGPPGTGKTYSTVSQSLKIFNIDDVEDDKRLFDDLKSNGLIEFVTFHQSFSYEDFVEGIRAETKDGNISYAVKDGIFKKIAIEALFSKLEEYDQNIDYESKKSILSQKELKDFKKGMGEPYVLIIDEINRGNTSRIFGELITLIESTKRAGQDEAMDVILPYSQERFTVPDNLYIIGTMNTADRSLALIDTALRRRFDFIEMMPKPSLIKDNDKNPIVIEGIDIQQMLTTINNRIEALYDREHTIGHAFFMKLKDDPTLPKLAYIFKNNILPLLEEYFFEDWDKIIKVLGNSGIYTEKNVNLGQGFENTGKNYQRNNSALDQVDTYINIYN